MFGFLVVTQDKWRQSYYDLLTVHMIFIILFRSISDYF